MKILNLTNSEQSDIKYKISKFPDGQQNISLNVYTHDIINNLDKGKKEGVQIKSRLNNFIDLELIICTVACLRELGVKSIHLYVPYFMGARSDRKFEEGGNWYLKQVICPIINSLNFDNVTVLDAHSYVLGNLLNNYKAIDNEQLVRFALQDIIDNGKNSGAKIEDHCILISPDAGASHKIQKLTCTKERDTDGKLTKTVVPLWNNEGKFSNFNNKDFIIIDDILDGGRTFINIAKELQRLKQSCNIGKLYLICTHGIFSAGFSELNQYFDSIYCTNSYSDIGDFAGNDMEKTNLKQINVF